MGAPGSSGGGAGGSSLLSLGLSVAGDIMGGEGQKSAADFKAAHLEQAAAYGKVQAAQTDAQFSEDLNRTLGNIDAIRAAANTDPTSPTSDAIRGTQTYMSERQRTTSVNNILAQARTNEADAKYVREAGDFAVTQSYFKAGTRVANAASSFVLPGA